MNRPYPDWICHDCGVKYGKRLLPDHVATFHIDKCDVCGRDTLVTEPRDFGHLMPGWERELL